MDRECVSCGFQAKNYGSLTRHLNHCPVARGKKRRREPREENETIENASDNEDWTRMFKGLRKIKRFVGVSDTPDVANLEAYDDSPQHFGYNPDDMDTVNVQVRKRESFSSMGALMKH